MEITRRAKDHRYTFKSEFRTTPYGREKTTMSLKFVTMRDWVDGLYSRALESQYERRRFPWN